MNIRSRIALPALLSLAACSGPSSDDADAAVDPTDANVADTDATQDTLSDDVPDDAAEDVDADLDAPTDVDDRDADTAEDAEDADTAGDAEIGDVQTDASDADSDPLTDADVRGDADADILDDPDSGDSVGELDATHDLDADAPDDPADDAGEDLPVDDVVPDGDPDAAPDADADVAVDTEPDAEIDVPPDVEPTPVCDPPRPTGVPASDDVPAQSFVERTFEVGIEGVQWPATETFADSPCGEASILSGGAAAADYDDDGDVDLFYARLGEPDRLYRNNGDGTFVDVAAELGVDSDRTTNGAAWVDIDGDSDLDLFVATLAEHANHLYIQTEDGSFIDEADARGLAAAEEDDRPRGCGYMFDGAFGDIDGDGDLDFYLSRWIPTGRLWGSIMFENVGGGFFERRNEEWGPNPVARSVLFGASIFDFDGDELVEMLLTADFGTSTYWDWSGEVFTEITEPSGLGTDENGMGTTVGDIDNDGDLDIFVTAIFGEDPSECALSWGCTGNRLFLNDGTGRFEDCTTEYGVRDGGWGWGAAMFDADNDGDLDVGMTSGYWLHWDVESLDSLRSRLGRYRTGGMRLWRNAEDGPFEQVADDVSLVNERRGRAFVPFDADRDGDLDLFVVNNMDQPAYFENRGLESRHWLTISLRDASTPNTHGIGATVWARAGDEAPWLRRDIAASGAFLSTPVPEAHFGLGDYEGTVDVRVRWPDAEITEVFDIAVDSHVRIER